MLDAPSLPRAPPLPRCLQRLLDALEYGSGSDYVYHADDDPDAQLPAASAKVAAPAGVMQAVGAPAGPA